MAGFNYLAAAKTALRLIQKFGQKVPIARYSKTVDPVTQTESDNASLSGTLDAVCLPASKGTVEAFDNRIQEAITEGKIRFLIVAASTVPFAPMPNDIVSFEGFHWVVLGSTPLSPAGVPVIYKFGMMKTALSSADAAALPLEDIEELVSSFNQILQTQDPIQ